MGFPIRPIRHHMPDIGLGACGLHHHQGMGRPQRPGHQHILCFLKLDGECSKAQLAQRAARKEGPLTRVVFDDADNFHWVFV